MTEEQTSTQTETPGEGAAPEAAPTGPISVSDAVEKHVAARDGGEAQPAEGEAKQGGPKKQSVQERIGVYAERAKAAEAERDAAKAEVASITQRFEAEIASIKDMLAKGQITQGQADHAAEAAKDAAQEAVEGMHEDIKGYAPDIQRLIQAEIAKAVKPFQDAKAADEAKAFKDTMVGNYNAMVEARPDMFGEPDAEGRRNLKPEFEQQANELADMFDITLPDGTVVNPVMESKEGLGMLLDVLEAPMLREKIKTLEAEKITKIKQSGVERENASPVRDGKIMTVADAIARRHKEVYG